MYPDDPRVADANKIIAALRLEQARGNFAIAQFYEKTKRYDGKPNYDGALIYYNAVLEVLRKPGAEGSPLQEQATRRIAAIKQLLPTK